MKKLIVMLLSYLIIMSPIKAFAESNASVEIKVIGEIKKGSNIEILIDVKNVDNLYAASIDFIYDTKQLKVESIKPTEYITKNIDNIMELGGEVDKNGNTATYSFTFLGDVDGLKGSGTLVKINAKVLNNDKLSITKGNMKVKLVQKANGTVKNYDYNFIGYNEVDDSSSGSSNGSTSGSNNGGDNTNNNDNTSGNDQGNNTSEDDGASGNDSTSGDVSSSVSDSSSNDESYNLKSSDNKILNNKNSNDKNNSGSTEENKEGDTSKVGGNSDGKAKGINESNTSKDKNGSSEVDKSNFSIIFYILTSVVLIAGTGCYFKFRKNKTKDK